MNESKNFYNNNENIKHKEISDLYDPISQILPELKRNIEKAKYKIVIAEDCSGRIPALVFHNLISDIYKKNNFEKPNIFFIATHKYIDYRDILFKEKIKNKFEKIFKKVKLINDDRILIVTETIATGQSLFFITDYLKSIGKHYDIITTSYPNLSSLDILLISTKLEDSLGGKVYGPENGEFRQKTHSINKKPNLSGVNKNFYDIISKRFDYKRVYKVSDLGSARKDIKILVKKLIDNFFNKS